MSTIVYALVLMPTLLVGFGALGYMRLRSRAGQLDREQAQVLKREQAKLFRNASAAE